MYIIGEQGRRCWCIATRELYVRAELMPWDGVNGYDMTPLRALGKKDERYLAAITAGCRRC